MKIQWKIELTLNEKHSLQKNRVNCGCYFFILRLFEPP